MSSHNLTESEIKAALREIPLGGLRFFPTIGSTNDEALAWATDGARDFSLVIAEKQTSGRGRMGRKWFTPPGAALAFSLVLRPGTYERERIGLFSGLGALALVGALRRYGVVAQVKWPNDVLVNRKKIAGILVETTWLGNDVDSVVLGMGVNVAPEAVPPPELLNFPATCLQFEAPDAPPRLVLLKNLLEELISTRAALASESFIRAWEADLAFRGETVRVGLTETESVTGQLVGLETDGSLRVRTSAGTIQSVRFGEVHLRPL